MIWPGMGPPWSSISASSFIERVVAELTPAYGPETPVVVAYRVSWPDQQLIRGTLGTIAGLVQASGIERQALILVGPALAARDGELKARSKLYDQTLHPWLPGRRARGVNPKGLRVGGLTANVSLLMGRLATFFLCDARHYLQIRG